VRRALLAIAVATIVVGASARAAIDGNTFTSETHNVRMTLPRGWRAADQPTYPGIIVRMFHTRPRATILLAVDPLDEVLANVAAECRTRQVNEKEPAVLAPQAMQVACQQRRRLGELGFEVAAIKEAERPWFDYRADRRDLRQGLAILGESVFTLVLAADTSSVRAQYARTFDKLLRSLRQLEASERSSPPEDAGASADGGAATPVDAGSP
jgi:hypothetical protein